MKENKTTVNGGIGFVGLLTIAFIVLKLVGVITWSWVWVLSPLWISVCFYLLIIIVFLVIPFWIMRSARRSSRKNRFK